MKMYYIANPCPECGVKPQVWESTFWGTRATKFKLECPDCGRKTGYYTNTRDAVSAWNLGQYRERLVEDITNEEGLILLLGKVMRAVNEDYQRIATKEYLTRADKVRLTELEDFIRENPYMLPYDNGFLLETARRIANQNRKTRKKHVS